MSVLKYSYHFSIVVDICWMSNALLLMLSSFFTVQKASDTCSLQIKLNSHFHILRLSKGNLIFCCAVPTDHNFWKTKIIIILISSKNISFFFTIFISCNLIFFLFDYNKINKKQRFSALEVKLPSPYSFKLNKIT